MYGWTGPLNLSLTLPPPLTTPAASPADPHLLRLLRRTALPCSFDQQLAGDLGLVPDGFVYLRADPATCMQRLIKRCALLPPYPPVPPLPLPLHRPPHIR